MVPYVDKLIYATVSQFYEKSKWCSINVMWVGCASISSACYGTWSIDFELDKVAFNCFFRVFLTADFISYKLVLQASHLKADLFFYIYHQTLIYKMLGPNYLKKNTRIFRRYLPSFCLIILIVFKLLGTKFLSRNYTRHIFIFPLNLFFTFIILFINFHQCILNCIFF